MRRASYAQVKSKENKEVADRKEEFEVRSSFSEFSLQNKPWRTLLLVFFLFFGGLTTLVTSSLILIGHLDNDIYADRIYPLLILGLLMFIPGSYYMRIAFNAFMGKPGYNYGQIPSCY